MVYKFPSVRAGIFMLSFLLLPLASASFAIPCGCGDLFVPNSVCSMSSDLSADGNCFIVQAPNVTIECNGFSIIGTSDQSDYRGVYSNQPGTSIKGCSISGFPYAIYLDSGADGAAISGIAASTSNGIGIRLSGVSGAAISNAAINSSVSYALLMRGSYGCTLENVSAHSQDSAIWVQDSSRNIFSGVKADGINFGIYLHNSSFNNISGSATGRDWAALELLQSNNNSISGFSGTSMNGEGISIESESSNNTLSDSSGASITQSGVFLGGARNTSISGLVAHSESGDGLQAYGGIENFISGSDLSSVSGSGFNGTSNCGQFPSTITISGSRLASSTGSGLVENTGCQGVFFANRISSASGNAISISAKAHHNKFYWNNISSQGGAYISDLNGSNFYNATTPSGSNEGNIYANVADGAVQVQGAAPSSGFPLLYVGTNGTGYPYRAATSAGKIIGGAVDYAPLTPFSIEGNGPSCGDGICSQGETPLSCPSDCPSPGQGASTVTRSLPSATAYQCSNLTVALGAFVNATDSFYAIDEVPPAGWQVTNSGSGDSQTAGHLKWVSISGNGGASYQYTLAVPCNALGTYQFSGEYGFDNAVLLPIGGQPSVNVVPDNVAPVIAPRGDEQAEANSTAGAVVEYQMPAASDNVGIASIGCVLPPGSVFPIGSTEVACTATDFAGNSATSSFQVMVHEACKTGADTDHDYSTSLSELLSYIGGWKRGDVSSADLLRAIGFWKAGAGC